jgi:hypothetical protein
MHDDYKRLETPAGTHLDRCPVCGHDPEVWQYSTAPDEPTSKVICCSMGDPFGPQDTVALSGCLLYMPPNAFYQPTIRQAARYWNDYAKALETLRRAKHWETARVLRNDAPVTLGDGHPGDPNGTATDGVPVTDKEQSNAG